MVYLCPRPTYAGNTHCQSHLPFRVQCLPVWGRNAESISTLNFDLLFRLLQPPCLFLASIRPLAATAASVAEMAGAVRLWQRPQFCHTPLKPRSVATSCGFLDGPLRHHSYVVYPKRLSLNKYKRDVVLSLLRSYCILSPLTPFACRNFAWLTRAVILQ